ncbi:serine hydrolase domain-containing protein [Candidatus Xianfuyuplasma coldseepsis]|uniref:Beta-lactamase family protein n=1 Tax=Candidatus Xianfuyuplasma coldseepsis TaxID=2782163 RepID=A0A7L7KSB6_9MOLU|nr:serine hydrolase domain-containing protein [Xianfuyuplasma coldseepsis]QMS84678.1 beta-lactamase family protein [Xianfuyuplasma coldseepsis]
MITSGTLYIRTKDSVEHTQYGYRDIANNIPINETTRFPTASAGKVFVAVGILQLIERGKCRLDSTLQELLDIPLGKIDPDVTIYHLLTHTSGVPDYCDESKFPNYADLWKDYPNYKIRHNNDLLPLFIHEEMMYPKGERFQYNNSAFVLLASIIEALTDMPFDCYLQQYIFKPLNMTDTGYFELDRLPENCTYGYILDEETNEYYTNIYSIDVKGTGAGGAFTNALDIAKFWDGLLSHKLLSEDMTKTMLHKEQDAGNWGYGLGIWLDTNNQPCFTGEDPGVTFITGYDRINNRLITIISNKGEDVFSLFSSLQKKDQ